MMLIIVALLVFYNELDSKMNIAEYILLFIALIVIIGAAFNYIKIDTLNEGFTSNIKPNQKQNQKPNQNLNKIKKINYDEDITILNSEDSDVYLDSDKLQANNNSFTNYESNGSADLENKKNNIHINTVDKLLGISSNFTDIPIPTDYVNNDEIKSNFNPKIIIGKGNKNNKNNNGFGNNNSKWNSPFTDDGFGFDNTMNPVNNLWRDTQGYYNDGTDNINDFNEDNEDDEDEDDDNYKGGRGGRGGRGGKGGRGNNCSYVDKCNIKKNEISNDDWSQGMDAYNKGKWKSNQYSRPSDYVDYISPNSYGTTTPNSSNFNQDTKQNIYGNTSPESLNMNQNDSKQKSSSNDENKKLCGPYTDMDLDETQAGDLIIKDYNQSKKWVAGYTYVPPIHWDVPQKRNPICSTVTPNVHKLTGIVDKGLPINALELTETGYIADTEDTVKLSNVGSMIPKFNYQEQPFSKPYI